MRVQAIKNTSRPIQTNGLGLWHHFTIDANAARPMGKSVENFRRSTCGATEKEVKALRMGFPTELNAKPGETFWWKQLHYKHTPRKLTDILNSRKNIGFEKVIFLFKGGDVQDIVYI